MLQQQFLDHCYQFRRQPIIRVATRFDERTDARQRPDPDDPWRWRASRVRRPTLRIASVRAAGLSCPER
jgi:hypothetical protein